MSHGNGPRRRKVLELRSAESIEPAHPRLPYRHGPPTTLLICDGSAGCAAVGYRRSVVQIRENLARRSQSPKFLRIPPYGNSARDLPPALFGKICIFLPALPSSKA